MPSTSAFRMITAMIARWAAGDSTNRRTCSRLVMGLHGQGDNRWTLRQPEPKFRRLAAPWPGQHGVLATAIPEHPQRVTYRHTQVPTRPGAEEPLLGARPGDSRAVR